MILISTVVIVGMNVNSQTTFSVVATSYVENSTNLYKYKEGVMSV
jgi:hypothetical protein